MSFSVYSVHRLNAVTSIISTLKSFFFSIIIKIKFRFSISNRYIEKIRKNKQNKILKNVVFIHLCMLFYLYFYNILFSGKTSPYMLGYVLHFNIHSMYFMIQWLFHRLGHFCQIENTCTTRERSFSIRKKHILGVRWLQIEIGQQFKWYTGNYNNSLNKSFYLKTIRANHATHCQALNEPWKGLQWNQTKISM